VAIQKLHDTHVHLDHLLLKLGYNISELNKSEIANIINPLLSDHDWVIQAGINWEESVRFIGLFSDVNGYYSMIGTHPEIINNEFAYETYSTKRDEILSTNILKNFVAIGEIGLDYHYTQDEQIVQLQKRIFDEEIDMAIENDLSFVIHSRDAMNDTLDILNDKNNIKGRFVVHCFSGNLVEAKHILDLGGTIGFGGISTYKSAVELQEVIAYCPPDRYIIETDLPYLAPTPYRGKVCVPSYIEEIFKKVSELRNEDIEITIENSKTNSKKIFNIT
jgi:TatD DNase family protein